MYQVEDFGSISVCITCKFTEGKQMLLLILKVQVIILKYQWKVGS